MLISSTTADAIISGQREGLRQIDRHGNDNGPCASGEPAHIICFTERGRVTFGLVMKDHPSPDKYMTKDNAHVIWSSS